MANKLSRFYQSTSIIISASALGMVANLDQASANSTVNNFTNRVAPGVKHASRYYNVWGSVMMAQAALESGWGQSQLSIQANNYFGIKGSYNGQSITMRTAEYDENGNLYYTDAKFKKYPSPTESMNDNGYLLRNGTSWNHKYYSGAWKENADTYVKAAHALTGKYATDPNYATKLINVIQSNHFDKLIDGPVYKAKYHVGQRVQLLNTASYETNGNPISDKRGKIGIIKKVTRKDYSNSHFEYYVAWEDGTQASYYLAEQDLTNKIVNYKAKYHVGQQVQVLNTASYETNGNRIVDKRGKIGTVKKVTRKDYSNSHFEYYVAWNDGTQASYYMAEQDLTNKIINYKAKYHAGQRVQVLNTASYETNGNWIGDKRGKVGTIAKVTRKDYSNSHFEYYIVWNDGSTDSYYMAEQDLTEHITTYQAKFKVGQRVQVLNTAIYETNGNRIVDKRGKIGTVKKVTRKDYSNSHFEYYVAWNDGTQASYYLAEQDLKLATGRFNAPMPNRSENNSSDVSTTSASSTTANSSSTTANSSFNDASISTSNAPTYKINQQVNVSLMQDGIVNKHAGRVIKINNNQSKTSYDIQLSNGSVIKQLPTYTLTAK